LRLADGHALEGEIHDLSVSHMTVRVEEGDLVTVKSDSARDLQVRRLNEGRTFLAVVTPLIIAILFYGWSMRGLAALS
jgi:hypothetical protein